MLAHFMPMSLPKATWREFRKALDDAQPSWVKLFVSGVGLPAWAFLAYRVVAEDDPTRGVVGKAAIAAFFSAAALQMIALFRAFWRAEL